MAATGTGGDDRHPRRIRPTATITLGALKLSARTALGGDGGAADNNTDGGDGGTGTGGTVLIGTMAGRRRGGGADRQRDLRQPRISARAAPAASAASAPARAATALGGTVGVSATGAPVDRDRPDRRWSPTDRARPAAVHRAARSALAERGRAASSTSARPIPGTGAPGTLTLAAVTGSADGLGDGPGNVAGVSARHADAASTSPPPT